VIREGTALRGFARWVARLWFHRWVRTGAALPEGPVLLVLNHPNGLLDPILATALLERPPRFVAKAALWKAWPLRPFLAFFRAIPVQRTQDAAAPLGEAARAEALAATFSAVFRTFEENQVLGIFPEGISHAGHDLAPLKTGPARMLLGAPVRPALVPAGLVYGDRGVFRHSALLRLGEAIDTSGLEGTDPDTVLALTARIRAALYPLTLHASGQEIFRLAQDLAWLLAEGPRPAADLEAFLDRVKALQEWLESLGPEERQGVRDEVDAAAGWLAERGLRPDQIGHPYPFGESLRWAPRACGRLMLAALCLPAGLLFWPAYRLVGLVSARKEDDLDVRATTKLLAGAVFLPIWSAGLLLASRLWLGPAGVWAWLAAIPAAILCLPVIDALREDRRAVRGWLARKDPAAPPLLEARMRLLAAVPRLREFTAPID
jgi:1-acyl-sn-glycerol-3-phosphate acyltransferase